MGEGHKRSQNHTGRKELMVAKPQPNQATDFWPQKGTKSTQCFGVKLPRAYGRIEGGQHDKGNFLRLFVATPP